MKQYWSLGATFKSTNEAEYSVTETFPYCLSYLLINLEQSMRRGQVTHPPSDLVLAADIFIGGISWHTFGSPFPIPNNPPRFWAFASPPTAVCAASTPWSAMTLAHVVWAGMRHRTWHLRARHENPWRTRDSKPYCAMGNNSTYLGLTGFLRVFNVYCWTHCD